MPEIDFHARFLQELNRIINTTEVVIDRPKGSRHPRHPTITYPLDYGYLSGTRAVDGGGIDVWVGSLPTRELTGVIATVDGQKRDAEVKVLLGCASEEIERILRFHNQGDQAAVLVIHQQKA